VILGIQNKLTTTRPVPGTGISAIRSTMTIALSTDEQPLKKFFLSKCIAIGTKNVMQCKIAFAILSRKQAKSEEKNIL